MKSNIFFFGGLVTSYVLGVIIGLCVGLNCFPSAMDVYQGKTTLEVTYRDSVAIDSCVVFKQDKND